MFVFDFRAPDISHHPNRAKPIVEEEINYSGISDEGVVIGRDLKADTFQFWTQLIKKYYKIFKIKK